LGKFDDKIDSTGTYKSILSAMDINPLFKELKNLIGKFMNPNIEDNTQVVKAIDGISRSYANDDVYFTNDTMIVRRGGLDDLNSYTRTTSGLFTTVNSNEEDINWFILEGLGRIPVILNGQIILKGKITSTSVYLYKIVKTSSGEFLCELREMSPQTAATDDFNEFLSSNVEKIDDLINKRMSELFVSFDYLNIDNIVMNIITNNFKNICYKVSSATLTNTPSVLIFPQNSPDRANWASVAISGECILFSDSGSIYTVTADIDEIDKFKINIRLPDGEFMLSGTLFGLGAFFVPNKISII